MALDTATPEELKRLTGLARPSAIKRFLTQQRIPFMVGADGWPRVREDDSREKVLDSQTA